MQKQLARNIYILSGLGADERVFQKLDLSGLSVTFVRWIIPHDSESIENYAKRLLDQIPTKRPTLIGLSFGGIMAIEIAKQIETREVILIASAKTKNEIPFYYRWAGHFKLHKLLPTKLLKKSNFISNWLFGANSLADKQILKEILEETDPVFLVWAIDKIVCWTNRTQPQNVKHIHGTADKILPFRFITCDYKISNGGHFMTLNKASELTKVIKQVL